LGRVGRNLGKGKGGGTDNRLVAAPVEGLWGKSLRGKNIGVFLWAGGSGVKNLPKEAGAGRVARTGGRSKTIKDYPFCGFLRAAQSKKCGRSMT